MNSLATKPASSALAELLTGIILADEDVRNSCHLDRMLQKTAVLLTFFLGACFEIL